MLHEGGKTIERDYGIDEIPVFARAGAVLPLHRPDRPAQAAEIPTSLAVFPGGATSTRFYEDDGVSNAYKNGEFAWTKVETRAKGSALTIEIGPTEGRYSEMPRSGRYRVRLIGVIPPRRVLVDGEDLFHRADRRGSGWWFDGQKLETVVDLPEASRQDPQIVEVLRAEGEGPGLLDGVAGLVARWSDARQILDELTPHRGAPRSLIHAIQTGRRIELEPNSAQEELAELPDLSRDIISEIRSLPAQRSVVNRALAVLGESPLPSPPAPDSSAPSRRRLLAFAILLATACIALYALRRQRRRPS
jgi:hypothetical protein